MDRPLLFYIGLGWSAGLGCALLEPYPGGGDPAQALSNSGEGGGSPFQGGQAQDPLEDPAVDPSITIQSLNDPAVANPGFAFLVDLDFIAPHGNVVGGGIRFPGSDEIQWTFIEGLEGDTGERNIQFGYVVASTVCDDIPKLCHEIVTEQFAVARNDGRDVDGDGKVDGEFVVSEPVSVRVILNCATCDSPSCQDLLPPGTCMSCGQPEACVQYWESCLAPGKPNEFAEEADLFDVFFGPNGVLWSSKDGCAQGELACKNANEDVAETGECGL